MATTTRVKQWGFGTPSDYTLATDATIAAAVLSMTTPQYALPFGGQRWSVVPDQGHYDGNGDLVLQNGVIYKALAGGSDLSADDGMFVFHAKRGVQAGSKKLELYFRYDSLSGDKLITDMVDGTGARILNSDGGTAASDGAWFNSWPETGTWRKFYLQFVGDDVKFQVGGYRSISSGAVDRTVAGTLALTQDDANNPVTVGNGGAQAASIFYHRRQGACGLKAVNAWPIPYGTTALGRLTLVADRKGGGTEPLDLMVQFRVDGAWADLPADGDLSAESFTAGTSTFAWRLNDGAGVGLDNANDCRYVPSVYAVLLTYEQTSPDWLAEGYLKDVLTNIKAALNADGTLTGYEGWSGAQVGWSDVMNLKLYHRCGCIVEWKETPETQRAAKRAAGALTNMIDETHSVTVKACMKLDRDLENMLIGDDQLLDFTEDVLAVLRAETLSDTVHSVTVNRREPTSDYFESSEGEDEPGDILLGVDIEVEVHGKPFEAVRP